MLDRLALVLRWLSALCRLRGDLALENLALRQQLTVLSRRHPRPRLTSVDRFFWVMLRRVWARWTDALIIVKPDTVVGWRLRAGWIRTSNPPVNSVAQVFGLAGSSCR
jgi:hypothetical protein